MIKSGEELDEQIAVKVLGLQRWEGKVESYGGPVRRVHFGGDDLKKYSTDISSAWEIVEYFRNKNKVFELLYHPDPDAWACIIGDRNTTADSAPLVICLAALEAVK